MELKSEEDLKIGTKEFIEMENFNFKDLNLKVDDLSAVDNTNLNLQCHAQIGYGNDINELKHPEWHFVKSLDEIKESYIEELSQRFKNVRIFIDLP